MDEITHRHRLQQEFNDSVVQHFQISHSAHFVWSLDLLKGLCSVSCLTAAVSSVTFWLETNHNLFRPCLHSDGAALHDCEWVAFPVIWQRYDVWWYLSGLRMHSLKTSCWKITSCQSESQCSQYVNFLQALSVRMTLDFLTLGAFLRNASLLVRSSTTSWLEKRTARLCFLSNHVI